MKTIILNLSIELQKLRDFIQEREDKVDAMSEKWQESEICEEWMNNTQEIEEQAEELDSVICNLQDLS
tara:strand:- start:473 stop:676 length:204 start_codon:yes stop_codon:yes gene_type:complete